MLLPKSPDNTPKMVGYHLSLLNLRSMCVCCCVVGNYDRARLLHIHARTVFAIFRHHDLVDYLTCSQNEREKIRLSECSLVQRVSWISIRGLVVERSAWGTWTISLWQLQIDVCLINHANLAFAGENWPELLHALFTFSQSQDPGQREGAFRIFTTTPGIIEKQHEEMVLGAFTKGFKDSDVSVRKPTKFDQN